MPNRVSRYLPLLLISPLRFPRIFPSKPKQILLSGFSKHDLLTLNDIENQSAVCKFLRITLTTKNDVSQVFDCPSARPLPRVGRGARHMPRTELGRPHILTPYFNARKSGI